MNYGFDVDYHIRLVNLTNIQIVAIKGEHAAVKADDVPDGSGKKVPWMNNP